MRIIRVAPGVPDGPCSPMFSISSHFALWDAASQKKILLLAWSQNCAPLEFWAGYTTSVFNDMGCVKKRRRNVWFETWIWRRSVTSQTAQPSNNDHHTSLLAPSWGMPNAASFSDVMYVIYVACIILFVSWLCCKSSNIAHWTVYIWNMQQTAWQNVFIETLQVK